jgi:hypothetical protein
MAKYYSKEAEFVGYKSINEIQLAMNAHQRLFLSSQ